MLVAVFIHEHHLAHCALSGTGNDVSFLLMELSIEHLMWNVAKVEHTAQEFADIHARRTNQYWAALQTHLFDFRDNGGIFLTLRFINAVVHIVAEHRTVSRDFNNVELIDVPKFSSFGDGRTGHTRELVIHTEIILQRDGGESLRGGLHLHVFLGFNGLVETIAPAAAFHDTSRLFVNNLDLSIHHHVFFVVAEHGVCLQQLQNGVNALALDGIVGHELILTLQAFLIRETLVGFKRRKFGGDVREHEELVIVHLVGQPFVTLIRQVARMEFFVNHEVERICGLRHTAVVVLHIDSLRFQHTALDSLLRKIFDERIVFRERLVAAEELEETFLFLLLIARADELLSLSQIFRGQLVLNGNEAFNKRLVLLKELVFALFNWTRDDQRRTSIVNQHRVDLIDDGIVVLALHEVFRAHGHIVAQIVETKFIVRTERDVGLISAAACFRVRLMLIDAVYAQSVEHIERAHPFRVTLGQIVVDCHDVNTIARQGVEEDRESGHEGFTFTRCHFGNLALMEDRAAEELHVIVHHIPFHIIAACSPVVLIESLVTIDAYEIVGRGQFAVEIGGRHFNFLIFREAACRVLDDGKSVGKDFVERFFIAFQHLLLQFVDLIEDDNAVFDRRFFNLSLEGFDFLFQVVGSMLHRVLQCLGLCTQFVVGEFLDIRISGKHLVNDRTDEFCIA